MNPIANLPATQNLNRPQQSQGYNRQYFGGDEVDQFELSQEAEEAAAEEQNKKKIWAYAAGIGAAIVAGAAVLLGLRATGHATWAKLGNNENSLTGLTKLSKKGTGDEVKKGATLAEGAMKGTLSGGSWNGISTSITGSASQYNNIIFIGKKENYDALKEKITDSAVNGKLHHIAYETFEKLKGSINTYLNQEQAAIIVDTDLRNAEGGSVYERIKKYWDESNSAGGETKAEEKKEEGTITTTTETDGGTGSVEDPAKKAEARKAEIETFIDKKSDSLALTDDEMKLLDESKTVTLGGITYHMGAKVENPTEGMKKTTAPNTLVYDKEKLYITRKEKDSNAINFYQVLNQTEVDKAAAEKAAAEKAAAEKAAAEKAAAEKAAAEKAAAEKAAAEKAAAEKAAADKAAAEKAAAEKAAAEKAAAEKAAAEKAAAEKAAAEKAAAVINQPANKNAGVNDILKVNPQKAAEISADGELKTNEIKEGEPNPPTNPADKPADKPVDSSNANENAADSNPPIATGAAVVGASTTLEQVNDIAQLAKGKYIVCKNCKNGNKSPVQKDENVIEFNGSKYTCTPVNEAKIPISDINSLVTENDRLIAMDTEGKIYGAMYTGSKKKKTLKLKFFELTLQK